MPRKLTDDEIKALLDSRPGWAILTTIDTDGFPHTVPLGYFRLGGDIVMGVRDSTRKVANVERNPTVSVMLEDGSTMADIRGVMFQGHARIVRNAAEPRERAGQGAGARGGREAEGPPAPRRGATYIYVTPVRTLSWHYGDSTSDEA
ncbi:pyridoxamine 5'-phosphate oxidase family protein [Mycobacterium adipatum]|uniref:pyridoxamine 5'-phosphate oxidase family protein n=1 Tax=Mycobacterium adipatum TaxID=1682113 RepID=UPI0034E0B286